MAQYEEIYDKSHLTAVDSQKTDALSNLEKTYGDMISNSDSYYDKQIQASEDWANKQTELQNQQLAFTEEKIEQQRAQAQKDYIKEQSGAYVDWQKQSNQYGAEAEKMAAQGLQNTGYSETAQVGMYNTYQNRVATAREAFVQATLNYDNAIKEAKLQNSATLAEIAYQSYQQQLELSLQGFQYKNALISELTDKKLQTQQYYSSEYQRILDQINQQNALNEEARQFDLNYSQQQAELQLARDELLWEQEQAKKKTGAITGGTSSRQASQAAARAKIRENVGSSNTNNSTSATDYFNAMIASGATKSQVAAEISKAQKEGVITKAEATELRKVFVPIGVEY